MLIIYPILNFSWISEMGIKSELSVFWFKYKMVFLERQTRSWGSSEEGKVIPTAIITLWEGRFYVRFG